MLCTYMKTEIRMLQTQYMQDVSSYVLIPFVGMNWRILVLGMRVQC
jgi:hypothetical protein